MSKPFNIRSKCPSCGERSLVNLVYGFPGDVLWGEAEAGKVALGGCVITGDDARYRCQNCHSDILAGWPTHLRSALAPAPYWPHIVGSD